MLEVLLSLETQMYIFEIYLFEDAVHFFGNLLEETFPSLQRKIPLFKLSLVLSKLGYLIGWRRQLLVNSYFLKHLPFEIFSDSLKKILFLIFWQEGKGERKGEKHWYERETSIGCLSYVLQLGIEPATQACVLTRSQTGDLTLCGTIPNQLSHASQSSDFFF